MIIAKTGIQMKCKKINRQFIQVVFQFILLSQEFYCHSNYFPWFSPIKMISYTLINEMVAKSLLKRLWLY